MTFPAPKILAKLFVLPFCVAFLNSVFLPALAAATLPNRASYHFDGNGTSDLLWRDSQTGDVAIWLMDGTSTARVTVNQQTILEYLPQLRLTETGGSIGITVTVRLTANGGSNFTPPAVRRIEAGTTKEVLNNETSGIAFTSNISSLTAQISFTDDAGRTGSVSVSAPTSDTIYPAVALTWRNQ